MSSILTRALRTMLNHNYHRQLSAVERVAAALFHLDGEFTGEALAEIAGISETEATEVLRALEHLGVVVRTGGTRCSTYRSADRVSKSTDINGCAWCGSSDDNVLVEAGTPAGEYLGLAGDETGELCDDCLSEVSETIVGTTDGPTSEERVGVVPIHSVCQADGCEYLAARGIASKRGHPHDEWKLCSEHYREVGGQDPWYPLGHDWGLQKLHYRCPEAGDISHNIILRETDSGGYRCSCGHNHLPVGRDDEEFSV